MELSLYLDGDIIYLAESEHGERCGLFCIPKCQENDSLRPSLGGGEQMALKDAFCAMVEKLFREVGEGRADSRLLVPGLQILGKVFTECVHGSRISEAGCIGFEAAKLYQWLKEGLFYFDPGSRLTGIETGWLAGGGRGNLDCYLQSNITDALSILSEDVFSLLVADGNAMLRSRVPFGELITKVRAGGWVLLYFNGPDPRLIEELGIYQMEQFGTYFLCSLHVGGVEKLKEEARSQKGQKAGLAGALAAMFTEFCGAAGFLGWESGKENPRPDGWREMAEAAAVYAGQLERGLEELAGELENPDLLYLANQAKGDLAALLLEEEGEEGAGIPATDRARESVGEFRRQMEREFYLCDSGPLPGTEIK